MVECSRILCRKLKSSCQNTRLEHVRFVSLPNEANMLRIGADRRCSMPHDMIQHRGSTMGDGKIGKHRGFELYFIDTAF